MIEIEEALNTSQKGARLAAQTPSWQRREWLNSVANEIQSAKQQLAELIVAEGVKTIREADVEVSRAAATFALSAEEVGRHAGKVIALDRMRGGTGRLGHYLRRPIGVVLGITPFNDPLNLVAHKLAPAIAAGNSVILKPHYKTPSVAIRLRELCIAAGIPPDVVTVVHCDNDTTKSLARDQRIGMVSFTGGKLGGAAIARASAGKPISLELGGVSSTIVLEDANLSDAIPLIVSGMFAAAGQNCLHVQRILVAEQLYHEALTDLVQKTQMLRLGDRMDYATDMGRLIDTAAVRRCETWVREAVDAGATLEVGGKRVGETYSPTILSNVPLHCRITNEEVFGPVSCIEKFSTLTEAIDLAGRSGASLAAGIFTQSATAPYELATLPVGQIIVNDSCDFRVDHMPFGGPGEAGLGREGVENAMLEMSENILICGGNIPA